MAKNKKQPLPPTALAPEEMADSTREQQEAHVRVVTRTCMGPLLIKPEVEAANFEVWHKIEAKGDDKAARAMIEELVKAADKVAFPGFVPTPTMPAKGDFAELRRIALPLIRLRGNRVGQGCNYDHNELICAEAFDGAEHEVECPGCGTPVSWRSPVFN